MRSVLLEDLDTMADARLREDAGDWGTRRPELRKHKTMKTIEAENRVPNNPHTETTSRTTPRRTTDPSAKAFQLLRDYEMATNILESRRTQARYSLDQNQQKHRLDKAFRSAPGGTKIVLDTASSPRSPDETVRRALRSASAALLAKNPTTDSGNEDTASSRDEDSGSGAGKKKKKTVSFQDENTASTASSTGAAVRAPAMSSSSRRHHMDHARCNDDETGPGNGHITSPIHAACYKGDHLVVSHLLGFYNGEDATKLVNSSCSCGMTPLQVACDMGHAKVVKMLLRRHARVNKRHHRHSSSSSGSSPVMGHLPAGFSTIGVGKKRHRSCIALACGQRSAEIVEMLLEHGATVDEDALITASSLGDAQSVRLLMEKRGHRNGGHGLTSGFEKLWGGASSSSPSNVSEIEASWISNAAAIAIVNDHPLVLSVLLGNGQSTISRERVANCAIDATMTADYRLLRCLTKMYDRVLLTQTKDSHGNSLLHLAVKQASTKCVTLLIRIGIDVNTRDALGITPLYMACARGQSDIVKLLVNAGATSECMGPNDETPLHIAAQENQLACVQILLTDGHVPVDGTTLDKCTALHLACQRGNTQVAKCLLDHGADINARTVCDETPLLKASRMSNLETVKLLLSRDAEIATSSTSSISSCSSSVQATQAATGEYMHTASTSSSVFSTNSSVRSVDSEVEQSTSSRRTRKPEQQAGEPSSDSIFIAKSNTHTSFKGWLKSVVRNK